MGKISDEVRKVADEYDVLPLYYVYEFGERNIIKVWNRRADHD